MRTLLTLSCFIASLLTGCSSECDCGPSGVRLDIAPASQGHIAEAHFTGPACNGYRVDCYDESWRDAPPSDCSFYYLVPRSAGTCHVEVRFDDGSSHEEDLDFVATEGCCGGPAPADHRLSIEIGTRSNPRDAGGD